MPPDVPTLTDVEKATGETLEATTDWSEITDLSDLDFEQACYAHELGDRMRDELLALIMRLAESRDEWRRLAKTGQKLVNEQAEQAEADLKKTEQALSAANCMLRDLGVDPATLEKP